MIAVDVVAEVISVDVVTVAVAGTDVADAVASALASLADAAGSVLTSGWFFFAKYWTYFSCSLLDSEFKTRFTYWLNRVPVSLAKFIKLVKAKRL